MAQNSGYSLVGKGRSDMITYCEHCGRAIINFANIKSNVTGKQYRVGLDCLSTLMKVSKPTYTQLSLF